MTGALVVMDLRAAEAANLWRPVQGRLADIMSRAIAASVLELPGPWQDCPDGRQFRVVRIAWRDDQGVVAEIEWKAVG
jgi:hypothetical protein